MSTIICVPTEAWHDRFIAGEPFGGSPPIACKITDEQHPQHGGWRPPWPGYPFDIAEVGELALVLAYDGVPLRIGIARALACLAEREGLDPTGGVLWHPGWNPKSWLLEDRDHAVSGNVRPTGRVLYRPVFGADAEYMRAISALGDVPADLTPAVRAAGCWELACVLHARGLTEPPMVLP